MTTGNSHSIVEELEDNQTESRSSSSSLAANDFSEAQQWTPLQPQGPPSQTDAFITHHPEPQAPPLIIDPETRVEWLLSHNSEVTDGTRVVIGINSSAFFWQVAERRVLVVDPSATNWDELLLPAAVVRIDRLPAYAPITAHPEQPRHNPGRVTSFRSYNPEEAYEMEMGIRYGFSSFSGQTPVESESTFNSYFSVPQLQPSRRTPPPSNTSFPFHPEQQARSRNDFAGMILFQGFVPFAGTTATTIMAIVNGKSSLSHNAKILQSSAAASATVGYLTCLSAIGLSGHRSSGCFAKALLRVGCFASASGFLTQMAMLLPDKLNLWAAGFASLACFLITISPAFMK